MKLQICAEIEGRFLLKEKVEARQGLYEFCIFQEKGKRYISVSKPVKDYLKYAPKVCQKGGSLCILDTDPDFYNDMLEWLLYIEATGAFSFEVDRIHVDELEVSWICENAEEERQIPILATKREIGKPKADKYLSSNNLLNLVMYRSESPNIHIPFSYYRQGKVAFDSNNYYFAFINFFMMLEYCFANGKFHKDQVLSEFSNSELLRSCVDSTISMIPSLGKENNNYAWIVSECEKRHKCYDFDGVIYVLVEYRGILSHATKLSKDYMLNDIELRPLAFITNLICRFLCGRIQIYSVKFE